MRVRVYVCVYVRVCICVSRHRSNPAGEKCMLTPSTAEIFRMRFYSFINNKKTSFQNIVTATQTACGRVLDLSLRSPQSFLLLRSPSPSSCEAGNGTKSLHSFFSVAAINCHDQGN